MIDHSTPPAYLSRARAASELCMSVDTFDRYVRSGVLPPAKMRGKLKRWKWSEICAALDSGDETVNKAAPDAYLQGLENGQTPDG